jgi:hypothetical protein
MFSRWKGTAPAGSVVLGADAVPNGAQGGDGTGPGQPIPNTASVAGGPGTGVVGDNLLAMRFANNAGWPIHRIAVGYNYRGAGSAVTLPATIWIWDALTVRWYQTTMGTLTADRITFFDCVSLIDPQTKQANLFTPMSSGGSLEALLIVSDNSGPNGEYRFGMGADLSVFS